MDTEPFAKLVPQVGTGRLKSDLVAFIRASLTSLNRPLGALVSSYEI